MSTVLVDPTLRRARLVRAFLVAATLAALALAAVFVVGVRPTSQRPPSLPSPRRALARAGRHAWSGHRPDSGLKSGNRTKPGPAHAPLPSTRALAVTAFVDPSVTGALASLDAHAAALAAVAVTGALVADDGTIVDRIDTRVEEAARHHGLRLLAVVQNLDEKDGRWRGDRVARIAGSRVARARLAAAIAALCARHGLAGAHVDLEDLDEDDGPAQLAAIAADVTAALRPRRLETTVDVEAALPPRALASIAAAADHVLVMAYDEHDDQGEAGPVASERYVTDTLDGTTGIVSDKIIAGLGIYGYDWQGPGEAEPVSFVDAMAAAKEAGAIPDWDEASGNPHFHYVDDEGKHDVWLLDAATLWNEVAAARARGVGAVALWRLGGEDPAIWSVLDGSATAATFATVAPEGRVINLGDGPFLSLALSPAAGARTVELDGGRVRRERWTALPSPWLVRRAGIRDGEVALTFDDGPDPQWTPRILDILAREHAPASFFVVGTNAERWPSIVQREYDEGHTIGNHSFTHPNIDTVDDRRLQLELELTSRLVESIVGRRPLLYRPPSLADLEPRTATAAAAFARAGSLGYLVVDADVDPRDWEPQSAHDLAAHVLDDADGGGVILLHDAGGNRAATVEALPSIIRGLRERGATLVPLASLVGKTRDQVMPPPPPSLPAQAFADRAVFRITSWVVRAAGVCLTVGLVLVGLRTFLVLGLAALAEGRRRRRWHGPQHGAISVVVPVYNERDVVVRTIESVLASDVSVEVIVVDDGSRDGTADAVSRRFAHDERVRLVRQRNGGKASALRTGFAHARSEVVVALDGDTLLAPDAVRRLVEPFRDARVGAVAGTCEVGNARGWLVRLQDLEYVVGQETERRAWDAACALPIVPGSIGAWRRSAVAFAGSFSSDTLAEDADMAMALCRVGWRVVHAPRARARTEAPETLRALARQRARWSFGVLQAMWKHRRALVEKRAGWFGRLVLPTMVLFQVVLPVLAPAAVLATVMALAFGNVVPALVAAIVLLGVEAIQTAAACVLGRRSLRLLLWLPLARVLYRPLLFVVLVRALLRTVDGVPLGWNKLARRGSVSATWGAAATDGGP